MRYCSHCAAPLEERVPDGDDRPRLTCPGCGIVHYRNPVTVVGCIVERGAEILLCRRAIEPACGRWTLPAGFLELGEGSAEGARRETREEACADVEVVAPHATIDIPDLGQIYSLYRARLAGERYAAGHETSEVAFFPLDALPWGGFSFPVVELSLRLYEADARRGRHHVHHAVLVYRGEGSRFDAGSYVLEDHLRRPLA